MKSNNTPATMNAKETTYKVTIANESHNYTDTKHNAILTGFTSVEAASKAAKEAARDIAGELAHTKVIYSETLNAFVVVNPNSGAWLVVAKVEEDSPAPEFSELSHAATNIVLTAENDGNIYRRHVQPLILSLVNKIKRGIKPDRKRLAQSSAMRTIIATSLAEMYCAGWMEDNTRVKATERKEAANYLAWSYISDAEDEYNNQMAAYK